MKKLAQLNLKNKKYAIFDVDGTLLDSIGSWNKAEQKLIEELTGRKVDLDTIHQERQDFLHSQPSGNVYLELCKYLIRRYDIKIESAEFLMRFRQKMANDILTKELDIRPDADKVILRLRDMGMKIILATMSTHKQIRAYFSNEKIRRKIDMLNIVDLILAEEDVHSKKPDPEIYNKVLEHYHAAPEECLIFEDSYSGVLSGKRAGIEVINIPDKYSRAEQGKTNKIADYKIQSYGEVLEYLGEHGNDN